MKDTIVIDGNKYQRVNEGAVTHVYAVLDRSGSMAGLEKSTIEGYNGFLKNLREQNVVVTTVLFDDQFETIEEERPIKKVEYLDSKRYFVRGGTALIDAVCRTLKGVTIPKKDKAIVVIITDGEENSSREYDTKDFKNLVEKLEGKGNWTFTYLGANQDAFAVAQKYGMKSGNIATYNSTVRGTGMTFDTMSMNVASLASSGASSSTNFFSQEDKEKLKETK